MKNQLNNLKIQNLKLKNNYKEKENKRTTTQVRKRISLLDMPKFRNFKLKLNKTKNNLKNQLESINEINRPRNLSDKIVENRNRRTLNKKN